LEESAQPLLDSICVYVYRSGLAYGDETRPVAREVLQEVALVAIEHADRFAPERRPLPWLLGIALNIIKRRKVENAKRAVREISSSALAARRAGSPSGVHPLEETGDSAASEQIERIEDDAEAAALLALVPEADQEMLRLAILDGWDRKGLAEHLGTSAVVVRVRLHRAIERLRTAWFAREAEQREGAPNG
jgi:RNA polymerase sigma factor (sigma-70 family)